MKKEGKLSISRRNFLQGSAAVAAVTIVPRHVLGKDPTGKRQPSETLGAALIGCGDRGPTTFSELGNVQKLAMCDVRFKDKADDKMFYTDYRKVIERKDIDVVAIATHPGWHALISIAAMEAGKDVLCEKPMCRFIAEGAAVAAAEKRYGRIFQIGTFGRFGSNRRMRNIFESGLLKNCDTVLVQRGGVKVNAWSGHVQYKVEKVPANLDWDMYCGPAPLRPFQSNRFGGSHRGYWDYENGGLGDMAHHLLDGPAFEFGRDLTSPVEITPFAPPIHPECCMVWDRCEMKYADGMRLIFTSDEWPAKRPDRDAGPKAKNTGEQDILKNLSEEDRKKIHDMPEYPKLLTFQEAVKARKPAGGNASASFRTASIYLLMSVAMRVGRTIHFDPVKNEVVGDEEANRLINQPMRGPWRLS